MSRNLNVVAAIRTRSRSLAAVAAALGIFCAGHLGGGCAALPAERTRSRTFYRQRQRGLAMRMYGVNSSAGTMVYADGLLLSNFLTNSYCPGPRWGMAPKAAIDRVD